MSTVRYAKDKPKECKYCYWWDCYKKICVRGEEKCYYILPEKKEDPKKKSPCYGCPYGRTSPCVGVCLQKLMKKKERSEK